MQTSLSIHLPDDDSFIEIGAPFLFKLCFFKKDVVSRENQMILASILLPAM